MNQKLFLYIKKPWFQDWLKECDHGLFLNFEATDGISRHTIVDMFVWSDCYTGTDWEMIDNDLEEQNDDKYTTAEVEEFYNFLKSADFAEFCAIHPEYFI